MKLQLWKRAWPTVVIGLLTTILVWLGGCGEPVTVKTLDTACYNTQVVHYPTHATVDFKSGVLIKATKGWWPPWFRRVACFDGVVCLDTGSCNIDVHFLTDSVLMMVSEAPHGTMPLTVLVNLACDWTEYATNVGEQPWHRDTVAVSREVSDSALLAVYRSRTMEGTYYLLLERDRWEYGGHGIVVLGAKTLRVDLTEHHVEIELDWAGVAPEEKYRFALPLDRWDMLAVERLPNQQ